MEFQHIDPQEAVEIHEDIQSNFSLGIHWGTFNLSYEVGTLKFIVNNLHLDGHSGQSGLLLSLRAVTHNTCYG